jgi:EAL domain-containing protein (putative c-di-GMP-specific phosphodiesterase class I)
VRDAIAHGRLPEITQLVLSAACETASRMAEAGSPEFVASVNVSVEQLADQDFLRMLTTALLESNLPASQLALEAPEHGLIGNGRATTVLREAAGLGVRVVIDDYWASSSELMLQMPPLFAVKVDLTQGMATPRAESELRRVIDAANLAGVPVIAKRVETHAERVLAESIGCALVQGNQFVAPMAADELVRTASTLAEIGYRATARPGEQRDEPPARRVA